jgi:hypothetical protein
MSENTTPDDREATGSASEDADEARLIEEGELDGEPGALDVREEAELRAQLDRELRFDGFEQGMQG